MARTPLRRSAWLTALIGGDVLLKVETTHPTGSFKIRGAFNAALIRRAAADARPLVTASAGNHGRALAHAARVCGLPLIVFAPRLAPRVKLDAIENLGATLRLTEGYDAAELAAKQWAADTGAAYVSPYAHPQVIEGAGTIGLEVIDDLPDVGTIVAAAGGGGLVGGIAVAVAERSAAPDVIGAEVVASTPFTASLAAGRIVPVDVSPTLADGLAGNLDPDTPTFALVRDRVHRILTIGEAALRDAIRATHAEDGVVIEGASAAAVAAVRQFGAGMRAPIVVVLSGGNIDPETLAAVLAGTAAD